MSENNEPKNVILNEEEQSLLLDHNYDGIEEFDYPLPNWWTMIFIVTSIFGVFYFYYYQVAGGPTLRDEFNMKMSKINEVREKYAKDANNFDITAYNKLKDSDPQMVNGLAIYEENCLSCHEEGGKGDIGPNLTDSHWLNVKDTSPETVYKFVVVGNEDNGMPAWGDVLSKDELYQVIAYVLSVKDTNIPGGKEPQGEKL
jgi:cytochrome c oxidase cbb3-type subunit 3